MKAFCKCFCVLFFAFIMQDAAAHHIKGGWIGYKYIGVGAAANSSKYEVTIYLYASCTEIGPVQQVILGVFDAGTNANTLNKTVVQTSNYMLSKASFSSCLTSPPSVCYHIYTYATSVELANNSNGYILTTQDALRVDAIVNVTNSGSDGITFTAQIPGTINGTDYHINSSPIFDFKDTAIICKDSYFSFPFSASDHIDGDSISYSFGNGLNVSGATRNTWSMNPAAPPYPKLDYLSGYSGTSPMGSLVTVDPVTGLISGTPPTVTGEYVIAVYAKEWRNGVLIDSVKKELQVIVTNCNLTAATLNPTYINCNDYSFTFQNLSTGTNIKSYLWNFGVANSTTDTSTAASPTYVYADTGTYILKLKITSTGGCSDSTTAVIKVYPGFDPGFKYTGSCYQSAFIFTDTTYARYGIVSSRSWDFGDPATSADVSSLQTALYTYPVPGTATVTLQVSSSKGCTGSVSKPIVMNGRPDISLPFTDTLICSIDSLPLIAISSSATSYTWTPNYNIINANTATPVVYPKDTTVYTVVVKDKGCIDSAKITVNVLNYIDVKLPVDTTICKTDSIQLTPVSYALKYLWTPAASLSNANIKYPKAAPLVNTPYKVMANLGKCQATATILVKVVAYPTVNAGINDTICFSKSAQLQGTTNGSSFVWSPSSSLQNSNTLSPIASPVGTTLYVLAATDTLGCPKPSRDSVLIYVIPKVVLFAGNDTTGVAGQPIQLNVTSTVSGLDFTWSPATWLSSTLIKKPVVTIPFADENYVTYTVSGINAYGCSGTDDIRIRVFNVKPGFLIPNAFSPNGDGTNDIFKPIIAGVTIEYFSIYDRLGQNVFTTTRANEGWDGYYKGNPQDPATYVWMIKGIDYTGKPIFQKGTVVLVR